MINFTPTVSQLKMLAALRGNLWMVHESSAVELALSALELSEKLGSRESMWTDDELADYHTIRKAAHIDSNGIGHIEIRGALMLETKPIYERVGMAIRYSTIAAETKALVESGARGIIYSIRSPGGAVVGNVETAELIAGLPIPTVGFCDGLSCSAAYKLSAGMSSIIATKSAIVGNIGTILSWADCSEFWQKWGVNFKAIVSENATLKSTFHLEPNDEQLQFLQESINESGAAFRAHVEAGRSNAGATLDPEVWKAGWYSGEKAYALGLIDGIGTREDAASLLLDIS